MQLNLGYRRSSIIQIIIGVIFITSIFASMYNDQMMSYAHVPTGKVQEWKNVKTILKFNSHTFLTSR